MIVLLDHINKNTEIWYFQAKYLFLTDDEKSFVETG